MTRLSRKSRLAILVAALTMVMPAAAESPIAFGDDPRIAAAGLQMNVFAADLDYPMGMVALPDGSILVASSNPDGGSFFASTGSLIRLTDHDGNGIADPVRTAIAADIPGPLVALARAGDLIFTTSAKGGEEAIFVYQRGERWRSPLVPLGSISFAFAGGEHQTYSLAVRETPDTPDSYDLFFNIGAYGNLRTGTTVDASGLITGMLDDASIYMTTIAVATDGPQFSEPIKIAGGLRNASALVFDPETGDLVIGENGIDTPSNRIIALSADEIDIIPAGRIGGEVEDFGFPTTFTRYADGSVTGDKGIPPVVAFLPIAGSENEGIAGMAHMPAEFPAPLDQGYVAGFHGQFDLAGGDNEENPAIYVDPVSGDRFQLIANDNPGVGHLDSFLSTADAIFVADLCDLGALSEVEPCGVIYRIVAAGVVEE